MRTLPDPIKGVIFDLDGTIVDRDRLVVHCTLEVAERLLGKGPNQNQIPWGLHETDTIRKLAVQASGHQFERALDIYMRCLHANLKMVEVFPGMRDLLNKLLKADKLMALVTSIPDGSLVNAVLERVQLKRWFKTVVTETMWRNPSRTLNASCWRSKDLACRKAKSSWSAIQLLTFKPGGGQGW